MEAGDRELLEAVARAVGVTPGVGVVGQITLGKLWLTYRPLLPRGRRFQHERNLLKPFLLRYWKRIASTLEPGDWNEHRRQRRRETTRLGRPPRELTLNLELAAAKRMFRWAVKAKRLNERPFIDVKAVKTRGRRESWFTADQINQLLHGADALRWGHQQRTFRALVAVMADTGLRISEALSLRWDRMTRGTTSVLGKGAKRRTVAFTPRALTAMTSLGQHPSNPHVFTNWRSWKAYDASTVRRWFAQAIAAAGLEGVKADGDLALVPHLLRHSFASIADERGAPAGWIQQALGHAFASTTAVYLHRSETDAAVRMAEIMSERKPAKRAPNVNPRRDSAIPVDENIAQKVLRA